MQYTTELERGRWRKATMLIVSGLALVAIAIAVSACGGSSDTTATPAASGSAGAGEPVVGGTLNVGIQPTGEMDPHFTNTMSQLKVNQQVYSWLVRLSAKWEVAPDIATAWEGSADAKTWTFTIRTDAKFNNGDPVTADDIVYTYDRARDPKLGTAMVSIFQNITSVTAPDATHVVFEMKAPNPEFPKDAADFHAAILSASVKDPGAEFVSSGPYFIKEYKAEDRIVLERNPYYYAKDANGTQLPYLDSIVYHIVPDTGSLIDGLVGGQLDVVQDLTVPQADRVKADPNLQLFVSLANTAYTLHLRSDAGHPAADPKVRLALRMGTDYQGLADLVRPGLTTVGNGTIVGPLYGAYYWDQTPVYDPEGAKKLLAEAGKSDLKMKVYVADDADMPEFAVAWQEQMKKIGVTVDIQKSPPDVYYGTGPESWLENDFGVTTWVTRATPLVFWQFSYVTDAIWNEGHWSDPEFDSIVKKIGSEVDEAKRAELYQQAQQILWDRGPFVILAMPMGATGATKKLMNFVPWPDGNLSLLEQVWLAN
ncbi:MAG: ABC transporter substrate-binding protein [Thermoleophilia bacterium]